MPPRAIEYYNYLHGNFTSFELLEFQNISGKYAKTLYRLLKQWKSTGVPPKMEWGEFRELMGISNNIKLLRVLERDILRPATQELHKLPHFENLCYEKIKTKGMGNRITHIQFYFQPLTKTSKDREQAKRDLRTIAWEIRSKKAVQQLKRSQKQAKQAKLDDGMLEVLGMAFYKPKDPSVVLVVDGIQPAKDGYEILVKYYSNNGVPAVLKIKDITYTETNKLRVDIQDIDKPHKILNPFTFDDVKHFNLLFLAP
ncbi:replication initiation protein [Helicobacter ailurogastricus]|uniref:Replication protein A n=1 Tax=Helicobacter ailurogastricus TaxID=1578720 RepID=A0A0K2X9W2_9HELI|nr:replication initiation protein [Helicobacter ailurogastricus]CRF42856.1 replication protein A [Helicobacter ailurogastricus]CRF44424.1 replication protein A [Helicobacter ailurogastricus]